MWALAFVVAYVTTCALGVDASRIPPEAVDQLLPLLRDVAVVRGLAVDILAHVVLLVLYILLLSPIRLMLLERARVSRWVASLVTVMAGWAFVFSANQVFFDYSAHADIFAVVTAPLVALLSFAVVTAGWINWLVRFQTVRILGGMAALVVCILVFNVQNQFGWSANAASASTHSPNVFILGVDSLSLPVLKEQKDRLPNIWHIWQSAQRYDFAYTPLARTCPAWTTILTGENPIEHGAVFNLRNATPVAEKNSLPSSLRQRGYKTVFALDERRFCHIDHEMGFDVVVGPQLGILDFAVQSMNDTPLTNIAMQWRKSADAMAYTSHNVAAVANYSADEFVESVLDGVGSGRGPVMAAVHLESAHYPYRSRHASITRELSDNSFDRHLAALQVVDKQVGQLMEELGRRGLLNNALVVLLSDHGESFGAPYPVKMLNGQTVDVRGYGHGAFLLKAEESNVVLGFSRYVNGVPQTSGETLNGLVSLVDVRRQVDHFLSQGDLPPIAGRDCMLVETGVRLDALANLAQIDPGEVVQQAKEFYQIGALGRMHIREDKLAKLIEDKDVGLVCGQTVTLYESSTRRIRAYERAVRGAVEIPLNPAHVARVQAYRQALRQVASR